MLESLREHLLGQGASEAEVTRLLDEGGEPFETIPPMMHQACDFLRSQQHQCGGIMCPEPHRLAWCGKERCEELEWQEQAEAEEKAMMQRMDALIEAGHTCIEIVESFPCQLEWCEQPVCTETREASADDVPQRPTKKNRTTRLRDGDWRRKVLPRACKTRKDYRHL